MTIGARRWIGVWAAMLLAGGALVVGLDHLARAQGHVVPHWVRLD